LDRTIGLTADFLRVDVLFVVGKNAKPPTFDGRWLCEEDMSGNGWDKLRRMWLGDGVWTMKLPMMDAVEISVFDMSRAPCRR
jgi:hypothetical protein